MNDRLRETGGSTTAYALPPSAVRETAGGFENVFQVLQVLPGAAGINDEDGKIAVRGGGPEHNLIVVDGIQIHRPQRLGDFMGSFVNPATIKSVSLDASGLEARYGGRLSSVTTIDTRDGATDRALAVSGSLGLTSGDALLEGRVPGTESGSWWATARGTVLPPAPESPQQGNQTWLRGPAVQGRPAAVSRHAAHRLRPRRPRDHGAVPQRRRRGLRDRAVPRRQRPRRDDAVVDTHHAPARRDHAVGLRASRVRSRCDVLDRCAAIPARDPRARPRPAPAFRLRAVAPSRRRRGPRGPPRPHRLADGKRPSARVLARPRSQHVGRAGRIRQRADRHDAEPHPGGILGAGSAAARQPVDGRARRAGRLELVHRRNRLAAARARERTLRGTPASGRA